HLYHPLPQHPAQVVLGDDPLVGQLGDGVHRLAPGDAHLHRAQLFEVARHRGLGGDDALLGQEVDQLRLAGDGVPLEQLGHPVLALRLGHNSSAVAPNNQRSRPRKACIRLWAWRHTTLCGPSTTSAATSSPRWAGRQCRNTAPGAARDMSRASTVKPSNSRRRSVASASWPMEAHTSVYTASAPLTASAGSWVRTAPVSVRTGS